MFFKSHCFTTILLNLIYFSGKKDLIYLKKDRFDRKVNMYDVINNLYHLIVSVQMETENMLDRSNNISVFIGLQNVMDRYGTDQKAIRYNGNIVLVLKE